MSGDVNVYSSLPRVMPIDDLLAALRARGVGATWDKDEIWAAADEQPWRSGVITSTTGESLGIGVEEAEDEEREDLGEEAVALGSDAEATAARLQAVYRLHGTPGPLLEATVDVLADAAPSFILDPESGVISYRPGATAGPEI